MKRIAVLKKFVRLAFEHADEGVCGICRAYIDVFASEYGLPCSTCDSGWRRFLRKFYSKASAEVSAESGE